MFLNNLLWPKCHSRRQCSFYHGTGPRLFSFRGKKAKMLPLFGSNYTAGKELLAHPEKCCGYDQSGFQKKLPQSGVLGFIWIIGIMRRKHALIGVYRSTITPPLLIDGLP